MAKRKKSLYVLKAEKMHRAIQEKNIKAYSFDEIFKDYHENGALKSEGVMGPNLRRI